jgi:hypothetical protein
MTMSQQLDLRPGELVEVRAEAEILATLDDNGALEGLPFMPEMLKFCGRQFRVHKRADKTCDAVSAERGLSLFRSMERTVHLSLLRCDGAAHGGCQAGCLTFWKEAWLTRVSESGVGHSAGDAAGPGRNGAGAPLRDPTWLEARVHAGRGEGGEPLYRCQATELHNATCPLAFWAPKQYVNDICVNRVAVWRVVRGIVFPILSKFRARLTGKQFPHVAGLLKRTPSETLDLQPGEWVVVKSKEEIQATLDVNARNRGLTFENEMLPYCGKPYRVLRRVERVIKESTGRMKELTGVSIILEDVICASYYRRSCPRANLLYWREIWLRRATPDEIPDAAEAETVAAAP